MSRTVLAATVLASLAACTCGTIQESTRGLELAGDPFPAAWTGFPVVTVATLRSTGTARVGLLRVTIDPPVDGVVLETAAPDALAGGASLAFVVRWQPTAPGPVSARLVVLSDLDPSPWRSVELTGSARTPPDCDDRNGCTADAFDPTLGTCTNTVRLGPCDDGNACTADDACDATATCRGTGLDCDDDDACTFDLCDPLRGCLHPPNPQTCADGDPCTADVCSKATGCRHPPATDGTSCGALRCDEAHLCVAGTCRTLDVRTRSDGFPCDDGDRCTVDDTCLGGTCRAGDRLPSEPTLDHVLPLALDLRGGATDGFRFVGFNDRHLFVGVDAGDRFDLAARLPLPFAAIDVTRLGDGRFAIVSATEVAIVDATDPARPTIPRRFTPAYAGTPPARLRRVAATSHALLLVADVPQGDTLVWQVRLPLAPGTPAATEVPIPTGEFAFGDLAVDGQRLLLASQAPPCRALLFDTSRPWEQPLELPGCAPVALSGQRYLSTATGNLEPPEWVLVHRFDEAGNTTFDWRHELEALHTGSVVLVASTGTRVVVGGEGAFTVLDWGGPGDHRRIPRLSDFDRSRWLAASDELVAFDVGGGTRFFRDPGAPASVPAPRYAPYSGLGDVDPTHVLAGGLLGLARLDVALATLDALPRPNPLAVRETPSLTVVEGRTRAKIVDGAPVATWCPPIVVATADETVARRACHPWSAGLYSPAVFPGRLATADVDLLGAPYVLLWRAGSDASMPFALTGTRGLDARLLPLGRESSFAALDEAAGFDTTPAFALVALRLGADEIEERGRVLVRADGGDLTPASFAVERDSVLVADIDPGTVEPGGPLRKRLRLYDLAAATPGGPDTPFAVRLLSDDGRESTPVIHDLRRGRAWLSSSERDDSVRQVACDVAAGVLVDEGYLRVEGSVRDVIDLEHHAVVATDRALVVVRPACR